MHPDLDKLPALKNLSDDVRTKALEFADALGARGPRPTTVLGTAVTLAKEWKSGRLPVKQGGPAVLVQPRNGRWIIRRADSEHPTHTFVVREDAVRRAQDVARRLGTACLVFGPGGTLIERYEAPGTTAPTPVPAPVAAAPVAAAPVAPAPVAPAPVAVEVAPVPVVAEPALAAAHVDAPPAPVHPVASLPADVLEPAPAPVTLDPLPVHVHAVATPASDEATLDLTSEPEASPPVVLDPDAEPIRVKKLAHKWSVILGDGRTESFPTRSKAHKRAKDLGHALGRAVVVH